MRKGNGAVLRWGVLLALAGIILIYPLVERNAFYIHLLVMIFFYIFLGLGWNVVGGFAGQLSLGHTVFYGIGAYTSTLLFINLGVSPWLGMFMGGILATLTSVIIGVPCFRLHGGLTQSSSLGGVRQSAPHGSAGRGRR